MIIGYGKIGRAWNLDPTRGTSTGGDADVARALHLLSRMRPEDTFVLVTKNSGENPADVGYPENVVNPWSDIKIPTAGHKESRQEAVDRIWEACKHVFEGIDQYVMWLGQHGTSNTPIPIVGEREKNTEPQISFVNYTSFIIRAINEWRDEDPTREEVWLCPDPRNYMKARDFKWPLRLPILAQFAQTRDAKNERYGDEMNPAEFVQGAQWDPKGHGVWVAPSRYTYNAIELTALPGPDNIRDEWPSHTDRDPFGMLVNENRSYVKENRAAIVEDWVIPEFPGCEIFGKWSDDSQERLGRTIGPIKYDQVGPKMMGWQTTLTTPASGSGWATAKPWECFRYGVVCFFHPLYDTQDHILRDAPDDLRRWLRVKDKKQFLERVEVMRTNRELYEYIVGMQYAHYEASYNKNLGGVLGVMERLNDVTA